jgi:arylsulfatase A-like enzyme
MICLILSSMFLVTACLGQAATRPNVVFILADDLGYGDLGVFWQNQRRAAGDRSKPWHQTPQIDRMAAEGVVLPQHYCAAPVCAPSRASLLAGLHQGHANVRDNQFDKALEDDHNLATVLKTAGYTTACIGKWGLAGPAPDWPGHPLKRGFDSYFGGLNHVDGHEHYPKEGPYRGRKPILDQFAEVTASLDKCYTTDLFTARAKSWIQHQHAINPARPFFLYLAYDTPHAAIELPTQPYPAGGGLHGGLQWLGKPGSMINTTGGEVDSWIHPDYAAATWDHDADPATPEVAWPNVYQRYATSVRRIDDCVGDLIQLLKDLQIDSETLLVFTSDNGPSKESYLEEPYSPAFFGSYGPFSGIKRDVWEGGIRVGAIARWPTGIPAGKRSDLPCGQWDWLPTLAEFAGLPSPGRTDGRSLVPALTGRGAQRQPTVYVEYFIGAKTPDYPDFPPAIRNRGREQMQFLRRGDRSAIRLGIQTPGDDFEVFNVVGDPRQANKLGADDAGGQQWFKDEVLRLRRPNADSPRPYDKAPLAAVSVENARPGMLGYAVYQGRWPWLPDFGALKPAATGNAFTLDPQDGARKGDHGLRFHGFFRAQVSGEYIFCLRSNAGARLRLHQALVIDDDFHHDGSTVTASIHLTAGFHPLTLDARHPQGVAPVLQLECSGPDLPLQNLLTPALCASPAR